MQEKTFDYQIGSRLKSAREELKLNQSQVANVIGVRQAAVSKIENGTQKLDANMLSALNQTFEIDINWLLTGKGTQYITEESETLTYKSSSKTSTLLYRAECILESKNNEAVDTLRQAIKHLERSIEKEKNQEEENEAIRKELAELKKQKCKDGKHCQEEQSPNEKAA